MSEEQLEELLSEDNSAAIKREQSAFDDLTEPFGKRLVLFGAGNLGRKTLAGLRTTGLEPLAFADNNKQLWNTNVDGLVVLSPDDAARKYGRDAAFITTIWSTSAGDRQAMRRRQLLDLGCQKVVAFGYLFWKYPDVFLPHCSLESPHKILQRAPEIREAFRLWADDGSRQEYLAQLRFRLRMDFDGLPSPVSHKQYFPDDLYSILPGEVFVDCGAFDGDTIRDLCQHQEDFSKIFAFEPDPINFDNLKRYITTLPISTRKRITIGEAAVGNCDQKEIRFSATGTISARVMDNGNLRVDCVCLDSEMKDDGPTFIKMDIEGSEVDALNGSKKIIRENLPILAICVYHLPDHLWRIPLLIESISNDYRFFLRPHDLEGWELVCYAVPVGRLHQQ